jgi:hypothetical protein
MKRMINWTMLRKTMNLSARLAVAVAVLSLATPGFAVADTDKDEHGPMPMAIVGIVFGGVFWLVSTPFSLLIAPTHIMDSFDQMVEAPFDAMVGNTD